MLNVIDDYPRECLCIHVDRRINAKEVRQIMARLIEEYGAPEHIRSDNGSEPERSGDRLPQGSPKGERKRINSSSETCAIG